MKAIVNTLSEFKNISWPTLKEAFTKTFVVIIFGLVMGIVSTVIVRVFLQFFTVGK